MVSVWMLLLACVQPPSSTHPDASTPAENDPRQLAPLVLPAEVPFNAYSRMAPVTLVDERGQVVLVLSAVGVALEVERLLADRALVQCTGCRAPVEAWVQRAALFVGDTPADGPDDAMLAALSRLEDPALLEIAAHGFVPDPDRPDSRIAPPWWSEGGYAGEVVVFSPSEQGWSAERRALNLHETETKDP